MALKLARRGDVPPFMVMDVMAQAARLEAAGQAIVHLEVGQPGSPAPAKVRERAVKALGEERLGYTLALGESTLRARIADHYQGRFGLAVDPERVVVTAGSSGGFQLLFTALFEPGDRVAVPNPCYPAYRHMLTALGLVPVALATDLDTGYQPLVAHLEHLEEPVEGLIVASPSNPVGSMLAPLEFQALAQYCHRQGIRLVSDEIYHGLSYGVPETVAVAVSPSAVSVNSFSKYFAMTGWRLGWMVVPEDCLRQIERLAQNFFICPSTVAQRAAEVAFECGAELDQRVAGYAANRQKLLAELPALGFERIAPADGAFYLYVDISAMAAHSGELAHRLLLEAGVATTPGLDFDPHRGHRFLRLSYAGSGGDIEEALTRLARWRR
ncbi:MAG: aminotransferase class I/II-fold pyridoxal phosphate-dependent enzyme [Candidatus Competibacterales bacterium]